MLSLLLVPVLLGLSMIAQRPASRWLKVTGPVWPLLPFAPGVPVKHRLAVRGSGALFTFALVLAVLFVQARRELHLSPRVEVAEGMAAAQAGVQTGDVITAVDGVPVNDFAGIRDGLLSGSPEKTLTLVRGERTLEVHVTLRDGLLGVKSAGESQGTTGLEALQTAVRRFFGTPAVVVRTLLGSSTVTVASVGTAPRAWMVALTVTLTISYWLMLIVEMAALALGSLQSRSA